MSASPNPLDYFAIQKTIADYCIALDLRDLDRLKDVFTPDLEASYPFAASKYTSLAALQAAIQGRQVK